MEDVDTSTIAGTAVARHGCAALLCGKSGSGKSDLALRAITVPLQLPHEVAAAPFQLISDDQTVLMQSDGRLLASAPPSLHRLLEVRGIGLVTVEAVSDVPLAIVIELTDGQVERMPEKADCTTTLFGRTLAFSRLLPYEPSAPMKLALLLDHARRRYVLQ